MGKMLARLPVDIPLGKMLVMGTLFHQVQPVLSLAAALSVQTPFTNRAFRDPECEVKIVLGSLPGLLSSRILSYSSIAKYNIKQ